MVDRLCAVDWEDGSGHHTFFVGILRSAEREEKMMWMTRDDCEKSALSDQGQNC